MHLAAGLGTATLGAGNGGLLERSAFAALAEALEGPGAQLSPRRTLERIQDALSVCKGGETAQCSVQGQRSCAFRLPGLFWLSSETTGASYDLFQHQGTVSNTRQRQLHQSLIIGFFEFSVRLRSV